MENNGWIKLHRCIIDNPVWLSEPFTRAQAWVDLLLLANHKVGHIRKRGILIEVERGQVGYSEDALASRWQWSRGKVRRFLSELAGLSQVSRRISEKTVLKKTSVSSLIYIVNYDKYQVDGTEDSTEDGRKTVQEQEEKEEKENTMSESHLSDFNLFYKSYPLKVNKQAAIKVWKKLKPGNGTMGIIMAAIDRQKAWRETEKSKGAFVPEWPHPATWLNGRRWEDETPEVKQSKWKQ